MTVCSLFADGDFVDFGTGSVVDVEEFDQGPKLHKSFPLFRTHFDKYEDTPSPMPFQPVEGIHAFLILKFESYFAQCCKY